MQKHTPQESSRLTIDIPKKYHQLLKAKAALLGKSLKEVVLDALEADVCLASSHEPNKETAKVIREIEQGINLVGAEEGLQALKKLKSQ